MRKIKYRLEVYGPEDHGDPAYIVEAETPFGSISKGDEFIADPVEGMAAGRIEGSVGKVVHFTYGVGANIFVHALWVYLLPPTASSYDIEKF
jgi:hypothetical protein